MKLFFLLSGLWLAWTSQAAEVALNGVQVRAEPVKISRRTFDPQSPPPEMPKLNPNEVGTCVYSFGCTTEMEVRGVRGRPPQVTGVAVRPQLSITLWTPQNGPAKILQHEEAHRAICEVYYGKAESIARDLAQPRIGQRLKAALQSKEAVEAELKELQNNLIAAFLRETATRCDFAQARFDAITEHSRNSVEESPAILQAIADEKAHYAQGRSTSAPATAASITLPQRYAPTRPAR